MYGMLFGQNPASDVILATLGLSRSDVGRFRDCFVADGKIVVYTRNGGGNRDCWHEYSPEFGDPECKNEPYEKLTPVTERREGSALDCGCKGGPTYLSSPVTHDHPTGEQQPKTYYRCLEPSSEFCRCYGCFMTYHVHKHPFYHHDEDDDFDSTYATIYFTFPPDFADGLKALDAGCTFDPDARWEALLARIRGEASDD